VSEDDSMHCELFSTLPFTLEPSEGFYDFTNFSLSFTPSYVMPSYSKYRLFSEAIQKSINSLVFGYRESFTKNFIPLPWDFNLQLLKTSSANFQIESFGNSGETNYEILV